MKIPVINRRFVWISIGGIALLAMVVSISLYFASPDYFGERYAIVSIRAVDLMQAFQDDPVKANEQYTGKYLEVTGLIKEIRMEGQRFKSVLVKTCEVVGCIFCQLDPLPDLFTDEIKAGQVITMSGYCTGYLTDIIMTHCTLELNSNK